MEIFSQCEFPLFICIPLKIFNEICSYIYYFNAFKVQNLETAANDIGKDILPQHLILVADCLSATGEFVGLNAKGIAQQKGHTSVSSPFVQACFSVSTMLIFIHLCDF